MRTFTLLCLVITTLSACNSTNKPVERSDIEFVSVYDSIESRMPGSLLINDQYAIWTDPMSSEDQAHIIDLKTNKEIGKLINVGNGPEEFITPSFSLSNKNNLIVYDMNNDKMGLYSLDSIRDNKIPLVSMTKKHTKDIARFIEVGDDSFVSLHPDSQLPFQIEGGDSFGKSVFEENINNRYNVSQGNIAYNPQNGYFIYSTMGFPYMAAYRKSNIGFDLLWEQKYGVDYTIVENELILDKKSKGPADLTLTKDYIVTLQRDYQNDPTDETKVGRDFTKLPQTLFLYDYNSTLKRIVNLHAPILRISADTKSNTVYAIIVNPEFTLIKCELPG